MVQSRETNVRVTYTPAPTSLLGRINIWTANQTFKNDKLRIENPAATFVYRIQGAAITAERIITLPLLTGNDVLVAEAMVQTLSGKTLTAPIIGSGNLTFTGAQSIITDSGDLTLNPAGRTDVSAKDIVNIRELRGRANSHLVIQANKDLTEATPTEVQIYTLDPTPDTQILVATGVPTATPTTPFWAQRANGTIPVAAALPANFMTFRWNEPTDVVTLYVNDAGVIRSVAIGTVV